MFVSQWMHILFGLPLFHLDIPQISPSSACFGSSSTLGGLVHCLEKHTVPTDYYDAISYLEAQPTKPQREAWFEAVTTLLSTHNNCTTSIVPPTLQGIYTADLFMDKDRQSFCVLYEQTISSCTKRYEKGWGFMAVPLSHDNVYRHLHLSAPHPFYDLNTPSQATHLFKSTGAKSLLIPGRMRPAYRAPSGCISSSLRTVYHQTDPAHNDLEPFFDANRAIWEWQARHGGCPSSSCAFIQFHGKAKSTCPNDDIFLSTGLANDNWYTDPTDRPIKRLKEQLHLAFNPTSESESESNTNSRLITISLPSDSTCTLTATKNVVGRYLNNHPSPSPRNVCIQGSDPNLTQGTFVHIEQAAVTRSKAARRAWTRALKNTFEEVDFGSGAWEPVPTHERSNPSSGQLIAPAEDELSGELDLSFDYEVEGIDGSVIRSLLSSWRSRYYLLYSFFNIL